ncbi:hypothetical protein OpiT1DRAFT_00018 [Opitutaceae bacterium TAV1]|nr:hypothetical protein OpiT1DRAFT_00018 [Opitutaceae bacterium TAV1]
MHEIVATRETARIIKDFLKDRGHDVSSLSVLELASLLAKKHRLFFTTAKRSREIEIITTFLRSLLDHKPGAYVPLDPPVLRLETGKGKHARGVFFRIEALELTPEGSILVHYKDMETTPPEQGVMTLDDLEVPGLVQISDFLFDH